MKLSPHFALEEWTRSRKARQRNITNTPNNTQLERICWITVFVLEPVRKFFFRPVVLTSGFRSVELNEAVGGVADSAHRFPGERWEGAVDFQVLGVPLVQVFNFLVFDSRIPFDQVILERGPNRDSEREDCIHYAISNEPRQQALVGFTQGRGVYTLIRQRLP